MSIIEKALEKLEEPRRGAGKRGTDDSSEEGDRGALESGATEPLLSVESLTSGRGLQVGYPQLPGLDDDQLAEHESAQGLEIGNDEPTVIGAAAASRASADGDSTPGGSGGAARIEPAVFEPAIVEPAIIEDGYTADATVPSNGAGGVNGARSDALPAPSDAAELPSVGSTNRKTSRVVDIDLERLNAVGMLTPTSDRTLLAEQYRHIKRPLLMQAARDGVDRPANANLIVIASALPNEGKTSTAINLAISIAQERDRSVLLVDSDVAKRDITNNLGVFAEKGLTDLLVDQTLQVSDVMLRTNIPKLSLLPAGQRHPNVTELFAAQAMRDLMADLSQRFPDRIVLVDSPPLLATSGASVLASLAGQILMVVEAVRTPQRAVMEALRMIGPLDNIGLVLNKARQRPQGYSYGYGYGYGYGYDVES